MDRIEKLLKELEAMVKANGGAALDSFETPAIEENKDPDNHVRRGMTWNVKEVEGEDRTLEFIGSDETIDRYGEIVSVDGWDLKAYKQNPVFLWAHTYDALPVGKATRVGVKDEALRFKIQFADYEFADTVYRLYKDGFLSATSVGFKPREWKWEAVDKNGNALPDGTEGEKVVGYRLRFTKQELLELSAVPVPANPSALIQNGLMEAVKKGTISDREALGVASLGIGGVPFAVKASEGSQQSFSALICGEDDGVNCLFQHHNEETQEATEELIRSAMGGVFACDLEADARLAAYNHLAQHYEAMELEAPEFKEYEALELMAMADEGVVSLTASDIERFEAEAVSDETYDDAEASELLRAEEEAGVELDAEEAVEDVEVQDPIEILQDSVKTLTDALVSLTERFETLSDAFEVFRAVKDAEEQEETPEEATEETKKQVEETMLKMLKDAGVDVDKVGEEPKTESDDDLYAASLGIVEQITEDLSNQS